MPRSAGSCSVFTLTWAGFLKCPYPQPPRTRPFLPFPASPSLIEFILLQTAGQTPPALELHGWPCVANVFSLQIQDRISCSVLHFHSSRHHLVFWEMPKIGVDKHPPAGAECPSCNTSSPTPADSPGSPHN
jgi:hypothetical protein